MNGSVTLFRMASTPIRRHVKVCGDANPYDPRQADYFVAARVSGGGGPRSGSYMARHVTRLGHHPVERQLLQGAFSRLEPNDEPVINKSSARLTNWAFDERENNQAGSCVRYMPRLRRIPETFIPRERCAEPW